MSSLIDSGEFRVVAHGEVELRFCEPIGFEVRHGWQDGQYTCVLREGALAARLRDRHNHGRGTTPGGAVKSLERKLLKLAQSKTCPSVLASLVEHIGPRDHDSRFPVTEMLKRAVIAQWLCIEERRGRVFSEVTIRQDPGEPHTPASPCYRLDLVLLEPPQGEMPQRITAVEIKSARADFTADHKWQGYIGRADRLYIATLPKVVREGELPAGVGLLELQRDPSKDFFTRVLPAQDFDVPLRARADLLYGLACCDRLHLGGMDLAERMKLEVTRHWESSGRRKLAPKPGVPNSSM